MAQNTKKSTGRYDWGLLAVVLMMLALGLVMVLSSSYPQSLFGYNDPYYIVTRQVMWMGVGLAALLIMARIRYDLWDRLSILMMGTALLALIAVVIFGDEEFGATRTFFNGSVQPSEPAKIFIIIYVSTWLASKGERIRDVKVGLLPFSVLMGFVAVLIVAQPNISTATLIVTTAMVMFFIAGADLRQLAVVVIVGAATFWLVVANSSYASDRVARWGDSLSNPMQSSEHQVRFAVEALSRGGMLGVGLGNSEAKLGALPLSWSDNIFPVIGEELGLLGCLLVVLLFAIFAYRGLRTALSAADNFGMLLATGITCIIVLQAILNLAVAVAAVPPTGIPLPFISYGGSSLATTLGAVGILLSISRYGSGRTPQTARQTSKSASKAGGSAKSDRSSTRSSTKSPTRSGSRSAAGEAAYARFDFRGRDGRSRVSGAGRRTPSSQSSRQKASTRKRSAAKRKSATSPENTTRRASRAAKSSGSKRPTKRPTKRTAAK